MAYDTSGFGSATAAGVWSTKGHGAVSVLITGAGLGLGPLPIVALAAAALLYGPTTSTAQAVPLNLAASVVAPEPECFAEDEDNQAVGAILRELRARTALTWEQLASIFSVSRRTIHNWVNGVVPSLEHRHAVRTLGTEISSAGGAEPFVLRHRLLARYGLEPARADPSANFEPILMADQTPLSSNAPPERKPQTRIRQR
jgi:transcriptional regulator with XRE-family HTH domain